MLDDLNTVSDLIEEKTFTILEKIGPLELSKMIFNGEMTLDTSLKVLTELTEWEDKLGN